MLKETAFRTLMTLGAILLLLLLFAVAVTRAQEEPQPLPPTPAVQELPDVTLPGWLENLTIAGLALAPVTVAVVQVIKIIASRLGLPEGYGGWITLMVAVVMVSLALYGGIFEAEAGIAEALTLVQRIAETMLVLLGALGWYQVGKKAQLIKPMRWEHDRF